MPDEFRRTHLSLNELNQNCIGVGPPGIIDSIDCLAVSGLQGFLEQLAFWWNPVGPSEDEVGHLAESAAMSLAFEEESLF